MKTWCVDLTQTKPGMYWLVSLHLICTLPPLARPQGNYAHVLDMVVQALHTGDRSHKSVCVCATLPFFSAQCIACDHRHG
jgi:hypothetical protein